MPKNFFSNKNFFKYDLKQLTREESKHSHVPGPAPEDVELGVQALIDWNRNKANYYVNGKSVNEILTALQTSHPHEFSQIAVVNEADGSISFKNVEGLKSFFKKYLLYKIKDEKVKDRMCGLALMHFIQSGLPHAANYVMFQRIATFYESTRTALEQPDISIEFLPLNDGVQIKEKNSYKTLQETMLKFELLLIPENDFNKMKTDKKTEPMLVKMNDGTCSLWGLKESGWELTKLKEEITIPSEWERKKFTLPLEQDHSLAFVLRENHSPFADVKPNKEIRKDRMKGLWQKYFIKLECLTSLTVNKELKEKVVLHDLSIKVSDSRLHSMFDKLTLIAWLKERLSSVMKRKEHVIEHPDAKGRSSHR